jgi:SAM-dependent methyltransferase
MDKVFESRYHLIEEKYWWCKARRDIISKLIQNQPQSARILDIGCASGMLIKKLQSDGFKDVSGVDISADAIKQCKQRGLNHCEVMDASKLAFNDGTFDILIASDILEHTKDDTKTLKEWKRVLKPGGFLLLFVPMFPEMWGMHDEINHHYRRYTQKGLTRLLSKEFVIKRKSYWNTCLFFPVGAMRVLQRVAPFNLKKRDQLYPVPAFINTLLFKLLQVENVVLEKINLPIGISTFAILQKK